MANLLIYNFILNYYFIIKNAIMTFQIIDYVKKYLIIAEKEEEVEKTNLDRYEKKG